MTLLDADVLIDIRRGYQPAVSWYEQLDELPAVPGFVAFELYKGCLNQRDASRLQIFLTPFHIIWPDEAACRQALAEFAPRHLRYRLGVVDALIAACALSHCATLCTFNLKHYQSIPALDLLQPYSRL